MSGRPGASGRKPVAVKKKATGFTLSPELNDELTRQAGQTPSNSRSALVEKILRREFGMGVE